MCNAADSFTTASMSNDDKQVNAWNRALLKNSAAGKLEEVRHFLKQGATPSATACDRNSRSALIMAAAGGYTDIVAALVVKGADIDYRDNAGLTALNWSVMRGRADVTTYLLSMHANVNTHDNRGITPVMFAVGIGDTTTLKMLKDNGAALDTQSKATKMTALLIAIENGDHNMVATLLALGANVNNTNHEAHSPLMSATESGNVEIVNTLINHGADTTVKNQKGMNALALARENGFKNIEKILKELEKHH